MAKVDPKKVFAINARKSPLTAYLNPNRVSPETLDNIEDIASKSDMSKAEIVRFCIEYTFANVDWFEVAHMKRQYKGELD